MSRPRVKVAVVGSGLAGLTAAYRLTAHDEFEVHLFEKASQLGMDSSSVTLDCGSKRRVDVPMRSFQGGYYPNLIALYNEIGAAFRASDFSYSFSQLRADHTFSTTLLYNGASGKAGVSMPSALSPNLERKSQSGLSAMLSAWLVHCLAWAVFVLSTLELLWNQGRLCILSSPWLRPEPLSVLTFEEWASRATPRGTLGRFLGLDQSWTAFVQDVLVPLFSAICTAGTEDVLRHPAVEFLEYVWLTLFTHHYVAELGVQDVVARLSRRIQHVHLSAHISSFQKTSDGTVIILSTTATTHDATPFGPFSHIIIATQANQATSILDSYAASLAAPDLQRAAVATLRAPLAQFHYVPTLVINHADASLLPAHPSDVRDLNLVFAPRTPDADKEQRGALSDLCMSKSYAMATHVLDLGDALRGTPALLQTTNPIIPPRSDTILSVARLQRAVVTPQSKAALRSIATLRATPRSWRNVWRSEETWSLGPAQGARPARAKSPGIWVCGSYAHGGIPLLEGCVVSATNVANEIIRLERTSHY